MSALYERQRPKCFADIIGNSHIIKTLSSFVEKKNNGEPHPHVFLFSGPFGCGKTTIGAILAKELGSLGNDYREIDSADFRGIETSREVRRQMMYRPVESSCKIWLFDECHKMTKDGQEALLKALEKTPDHVYFILCTTEPRSLLDTITSRCSKHQVELLNDGEMLQLIRTVVRNEKEKLQKSVYDYLIEYAQGHPRDALVQLEQVLANAPEDRPHVVQEAKIIEGESIDLCRALIKAASWKEISYILGCIGSCNDIEGIRRHVLRYCTTVLLKEDKPIAGLIMEKFINPFFNSGFSGLVFACYSVYIEYSD